MVDSEAKLMRSFGRAFRMLEAWVEAELMEEIREAVVTIFGDSPEYHLVEVLASADNALPLYGMDMCRISDLPISDKRYGKTECYAWASASSPLNSWIFNDCLGLRDGETTAYDSLRMDWLLESPRSFATHFIQGLAESDGWPDAGDDVVKVVSSPNTRLFRHVLENNGCPSQIVDQPPVELLRCRTEDAAALPCSSAHVFTAICTTTCRPWRMPNVTLKGFTCPNPQLT
jgi:hypothetical protein